MDKVYLMSTHYCRKHDAHYNINYDQWTESTCGTLCGFCDDRPRIPSRLWCWRILRLMKLPQSIRQELIKAWQERHGQQENAREPQDPQKWLEHWITLACNRAEARGPGSYFYGAYLELRRLNRERRKLHA